MTVKHKKVAHGCQFLPVSPRPSLSQGPSDWSPFPHPKLPQLRSWAAFPQLAFPSTQHFAYLVFLYPLVHLPAQAPPLVQQLLSPLPLPHMLGSCPLWTFQMPLPGCTLPFIYSEPSPSPYRATVTSLLSISFLDLFHSTGCAVRDHPYISFRVFFIQKQNNEEYKFMMI